MICSPTHQPTTRSFSIIAGHEGKVEMIFLIGDALESA